MEVFKPPRNCFLYVPRNWLLDTCAVGFILCWLGSLSLSGLTSRAGKQTCKIWECGMMASFFHKLWTERCYSFWRCPLANLSWLLFLTRQDSRIECNHKLWQLPIHHYSFQAYALFCLVNVSVGLCLLEQGKYRGYSAQLITLLLTTYLLCLLSQRNLSTTTMGTSQSLALLTYGQCQ